MPLSRFEMVMTAADRRDLQGGVDRSGLSASAIVRFGMKWAINRLDVLASAGGLKPRSDIAAFLDEMRADARLAPMVDTLGEKLSALDCEGDGNPSAAVLHDMVGLVAAEPLPLPERLTLLGDLLAFEGKLTIRRRTEPAQISQSAGG